MTFALGSFFTVEPGHTALVKDMRTGVLSETYGPGWHGKTPLLQSEIEINTQRQTYTVTAIGISQDLQETTTEVSVTYQPVDVAWLYNELGVRSESFGDTFINLDKVLPQAVQAGAKDCIAPHRTEELNNVREKVRMCINTYLSNIMTSSYRTTVHEVQITDFDFSAAVNAAVEAKKVAEQQREQQRAESEKQKIIADAELYRRQQEAQAVKAQADSEAYRVNVTASAQAEAAQLINNALAQNPYYIQYLYVQNGKNLMPQTLVVGGNETGGVPLLLNLVP